MSRADDARARIATNPFYVLALPVACSRAEVEREGQKLLAMLELGITAAATYDSPLGARARTPDLVRNAMSELRDPERRLRHELWARVGIRHAPRDAADQTAADPGDPRAASAWADAMIATGWRSR